MSGVETANRLSFTGTGGYVFNSGTISLLGTSPTITNNNLTITEVINSVVSGSNVTIACGAANTTNGQVTLTAGNLLSGTVTMPGGQLNIIPAGAVNGATNNPMGTATISLGNVTSLLLRDDGDNTATAQTINYGNNLIVNNASLNIGRVTGSNGSNKTIEFGAVNITAGTMTVSGLANGYAVLTGAVTPLGQCRSRSLDEHADPGGDK